MITYTWKCTKCDVRCDVERELKNYGVPPTDAECMNDCSHEWVKVLYAPNVPFTELRDKGVFMDEHGNYPPRSM